MTDVESVVPLISKNISLNHLQPEQCEAKPLFWGNEEHLKECVQALNSTVDFVVGADVVFDFDNFDGMMNILDTLATSNSLKQGFFGFTHRFKDVEKWFAEMLAEKGFKIQKDTFALEQMNVSDFTILVINR